MKIMIYDPVLAVPGLVGNPVYLEVPESHTEKRRGNSNQGNNFNRNYGNFSALRMLSTRIFGERVRFS